MYKPKNFVIISGIAWRDVTPQFSEVKMKTKNTDRRFGVLRVLAYARYAIAGGIGGIAVYNTCMLIVSIAPTQSAESVAMAAGAILAAGLVKVLHVV